jgi:hypothetical protein
MRRQLSGYLKTLIRKHPDYLPVPPNFPRALNTYASNARELGLGDRAWITVVVRWTYQAEENAL